VVAALVAVVVVLLVQIPVSPDAALRLAGAAGRMRVFDLSFDPRQTYTVWSGVIGGTFLMMSYFGTDQSQVQRYLTAKSDGEARSSLLISAYWKIPLQALVLLVGVLVFVYYVFVTPPLLYNPAQARALRAAQPAAYRDLNSRYLAAVGERGGAAQVASLLPRAGPARSQALAAFSDRNAAVDSVRNEALALAQQVTGESSRDVNYIIPWFVLHGLPVGLAGIFVAAIMAAAMSAVSGELNSLSTVTVIDYYRRWVRPQASDAHFLWVSKAATGFWGIFACVVATFAATLGSLIEVVNRFGSFFYGSILGVFLLAMIPGARARGAFVGLIAGMIAVGVVNFGEPSVSFLWHNVIGAVTVVVVGMVLSGVARPA